MRTVKIVLCGNSPGEIGWSEYRKLASVGSMARRVRATLLRAARYAACDGSGYAHYGHMSVCVGRKDLS